MNTISYWEQQGFGTADWVVDGAGWVGLQSASRIKETYPKARVVVLDEH
jgi:protoporphyrinogen oxidase